VLLGGFLSKEADQAGLVLKCRSDPLEAGQLAGLTFARNHSNGLGCDVVALQACLVLISGLNVLTSLEKCVYAAPLAILNRTNWIEIGKSAVC